MADDSKNYFYAVKNWFVFFFVLILSFASTDVYAGSIDSLLNRLGALEDKNELSDLDEKSILCNDIAVQYQGLGENHAARTYFLQSIHFAEERINRENNWDAQNHYDMGYLYKNMAIFEATQANHQQSELYMARAEEHYNALRNLLPIEEYNRIMVEFYSTNFVRAYHSADFDMAEYNVLKVEKLARETNSSDLARAYRYHGELYSSFDEYETAKSYFISALEIIDTSETIAVNEQAFIHSLITVYYHLGEFQEIVDFMGKQPPYDSEEGIREFSSTPNPHGLHSFLNNVFILAYAKLSLYKETKDPVNLKDAYHLQNLAFVLAEEQTLRTNAEKIGSTISSPKNKVMGLLMASMDLKEIGELEENAILNALRIIDVYHSARLHLERISYDLNAQLWGEQKELKNQLDHINAQLEETSLNAQKSDTDSLRNLSYELSLKLQNLNKSTKKNKVLDEYRIGRDEFTALLQDYVKESEKNILTYFYDEGNDSLYTLGINADTTFILIHPIDSNFTNEIRELYHLNASLQFSSDKIERQSELNSRFYNILFEPVEPLLNGTELLIYPINELSYISFEALLDAEDNYLVNRFSFHYTTSLFSIIGTEKSTIKDQMDFVSFYPSDYGTDSLAYLFNAQTEVGEIREFLGGRNYSGAAADKGTFMDIARQSGIVHLASHSILNFEKPYESYIILNANAEEEYRLYAYEIFAQTFNSELVILSSCNSASGEIEEGIGVVSLSNAFYFAGVPATVSSLWSAQDKSSSEIMVEFYKNLHAGHTKSESLRLAKLNYLKEADKIKKQPFFWANYVVYGDDAPLFEKASSNSWTTYLIGIGLCCVLGMLGWFYFKAR